MQNPLVTYDYELQYYKTNHKSNHSWPISTMCLVKHKMDMHYRPQAVALIS